MGIGCQEKRWLSSSQRFRQPQFRCGKRNCTTEERTKRFAGCIRDLKKGYGHTEQLTEAIYSATNKEAKKRKVSVNSVLNKLGVSTSGYYSWKKREPSEQEKRKQEIKVEITQIYNESHQIYGAPKIAAILQSRGLVISEKTVGNYMGEEGIKAIWVRPYVRTKCCLVNVYSFNLYARECQGSKVTVTGSNRLRGKEFLDEAAGLGAANRASFIQADLLSLSENRRVIQEVQARHESLDGLVLTAMQQFPKRKLTPDGFESTFALYYISRFILSYGLTDLLEKGKNPVIVSIGVPE